MNKDDFILRSIEENLSGLRVSRQQQLDMIEDITGGGKMKKKITLSIALAAVLVLCTLTAALAVGIFASANWLGELIPDEQNPALLPAPTDTPISERDRAATFGKIHEILADRQARERVMVYDSDHSAVSAPGIQTVRSMEELAALLSDAANLPLPGFIPDGYAFAECTLLFDCLPEGAFRLTSREALPDGLVVERYSVDESASFISGYDLTLRNPNDFEDYLAVHVSLEPLSSLAEHSIGVNPDQQLRVLDVPGMEHALAVISDSHVTLSMRRTLDEGVDFLRLGMNGETEIDNYGEVQVNLMTRYVEVGVLAEMFGGGVR